MLLTITGAAGVLGGHVVDAAVQAGHEVLAIDRPGTDLPAGELIRTGAVDLTDYASLLPAIEGSDGVIHLAAITRPRDRPEPEVHNNNVVSSYNVMTAAGAAGIRNLCYVSSVNAIGGLYSAQPRYDYFPVDETHAAYTADPYSLSKHVGEVQAADFARRHPTANVVSLRIHALMEDRAQYEAWAVSNDGATGRDLWGYTMVADATAACLAAVAGAAPRNEVLYVVSPTTSSDRATLDLCRDHHPDVPIRSDMAGHAGLFDCSRLAAVLGIVPTSASPSP